MRTYYKDILHCGLLPTTQRLFPGEKNRKINLDILLDSSKIGWQKTTIKSYHVEYCIRKALLGLLLTSDTT